MDLMAVNFHVWKPCNYKCKFCFAVFDDVPGRLTRDQAVRVVELLAPHCDKSTFVGGEPTLCPFLGELIEAAHRVELTTCVVSNGERLRPILERHAASLDWIGLSVDSASEETCARLGRGPGGHGASGHGASSHGAGGHGASDDGASGHGAGGHGASGYGASGHGASGHGASGYGVSGHVRRSIELAALARERGVRIKLNTVVTAWSCDEDMSGLVREIRPDRWKVFRVLPVAGQNDGRVEPLLITTEQFRAFLDRHAHLAAEGLPPVAEDNEDMMGSYVMIDPMGRFFDNVDGRLVYGPPILERGVEEAFAAVRWERQRMLDRGGLYQWRRAPRGRAGGAPGR